MGETGTGWMVLMVVFQVGLTGIGSVGVLLLRKALNGYDCRIKSLEKQTREGAVQSVVADGRIKEVLAGGYVPRDECRVRHAQEREDKIRLFGKLETIERGQGRIEGEMKGLSAAFRNGGDHAR